MHTTTDVSKSLSLTIISYMTVLYVNLATTLHTV